MRLSTEPTVHDVSEALGLRLLAGNRLSDRTVSAVHVIELAGPWNHLVDGELVLSNGLWHDEGTDTMSYVSRLADHGISGLRYGLMHVGDEVPQDMATKVDFFLALSAAEGRHPEPSPAVFEPTVATAA
jgi:hypothetical protein